MIKTGLTVAAIVVAAITVGGCAKRGDHEGQAGNYLTVKGSDTMVHLASSWAEAFMAEHEGVEISVTGGGSGTGIAALLNGTTNICAASRSIKAKELELAEQKDITPKEIVVARDGIAVIVNPENEVDGTTLAQLKGIFTGVLTKWSEVGGGSDEIMVLSRESSSGTYVFFQEKVLEKQDYVTKARLMPATSAIVQTVAADKSAIGYVGLGYALGAGEKVKVLAVKAAADAVGVLPSEDTVASGEYEIARPLHLYVNGEPTGATQEFVDFCLSEQGQAIVEETGYVRVK